MFNTTPTTPLNDDVLTPIPDPATMDVYPPPEVQLRGVSHYRLRKNLRDIGLYQRYPRLSYKWRLRMRGQSDPRNVPDEDGKVRAAPRGKPRKEPGP